jgi:2-hydroxychromene-2-carboxylate isomerase
MYWADTEPQDTNGIDFAVVAATRFFFGAMSPYSWFAAERIATVLPDAQWRPVFAGALFRANGRGTWGLTERREAGLADCEARAAAHGLGPIVWPDPWPTNDVVVARAMAYADHEGCLRPFAIAAMRLAFLEGGDLGELDVVQTAAGRVGLDPERLARAVSEQQIKDAVRAAHDEAMSFGVFGVPTVVVGDQLFWGDDRLEQAVSAAAV